MNSITSGSLDSVDGIHASNSTFNVAAQTFANAEMALLPSWPKSGVTKASSKGENFHGNFNFGLLSLCLLWVTLLAGDNWFSISWMVTVVCSLPFPVWRDLYLVPMFEKARTKVGLSYVSRS